MHFRYLIFFASYCFFQSALAQNYQQCRNLQGQSYAYCMDAVSKGQSPLAPPTSAGNPPQRPSAVTAPSQQTPPQVRTAPPQVNPPVVNYGQPPVVAPPRVNTPAPIYTPPVLAPPRSNYATPPTVQAPINNQSVARPPQVSAPVQEYDCRIGSNVFRVSGSYEQASAKCRQLNTQTSQVLEPPQVNAPYTTPSQTTVPVTNAPQQFTCQTSIANRPFSAINAADARVKCDALVAQDARPTVAPPTNQPVVSTHTVPRVEQPTNGVATNIAPSVSTPQQSPSQVTYATTDTKLTSQPFDCPVKGGRVFTLLAASEEIARARCSALRAEHGQPVSIVPTPTTNATNLADLKPVFKYDCYEFQGQGVLGRPYKDIEKKFIADCTESIASNLMALQKTDEEIKQRLYAANIVFQTDMVALELVTLFLSKGRSSALNNRARDFSIGTAAQFLNIGKKVEEQLWKRGWVKGEVLEVIRNPFRTSPSVNKATGNKATAFFTKDNHYIVIDNITKEIVQISSKLDKWIPDLEIVRPYQ